MSPLDTLETCRKTLRMSAKSGKTRYERREVKVMRSTPSIHFFFVELSCFEAAYYEVRRD
jgi:hypothetical protein